MVNTTLHFSWTAAPTSLLGGCGKYNSSLFLDCSTNLITRWVWEIQLFTFLGLQHQPHHSVSSLISETGPYNGWWVVRYSWPKPLVGHKVHWAKDKMGHNILGTVMQSAVTYSRPRHKLALKTLPALTLSFLHHKMGHIELVVMQSGPSHGHN